MKIIKIILQFSSHQTSLVIADDFNSWINSFKKYAMKKGISKKTLDETMSKLFFFQSN